jgi:hypothetical protein
MHEEPTTAAVQRYLHALRRTTPGWRAPPLDDSSRHSPLAYRHSKDHTPRP